MDSTIREVGPVPAIDLRDIESQVQLVVRVKKHLALVPKGQESLLEIPSTLIPRIGMRALLLVFEGVLFCHKLAYTNRPASAG